MTQQAKPISTAVIGTGFIGPVHVEGLRRAGINVRGILGSSPEKSRMAADKLSIEKVYNNLDDLLSDSEVDVVHVTSPNRYHFEQSMACLKAGRHVLCEKPLAMNSSQSAQLVKTAGDSGCVAGVSYNIRYYPLCLEAADQVRRGAVGDLFHVSGSYIQDWLFYETDYNWRVLADDGGELRAVADIGTHWLDLIQFITSQKVTSVCADLQTVYPVRKRPVGSVETFSGSPSSDAATEPVSITTEDAGAILLKFDGGARGVLRVSQVTAGRRNWLEFELAGSRCAIQWCSERPNEMWTGHRDSPNQTLLRDPALLSDRAAHHADYPGGHNQGFPDTFKQLFRDFYGYISNGDFSGPQSFPTFEDGHREILLCEAILNSHRQQRWVAVSA